MVHTPAHRFWPTVMVLIAACGGTTVAPTPIVVSVTPSSPAMGAGESRQFTATVANATNTAVTWSATGGTISGSGLTVSYTAPAAGGSYTITATSVEDPTRKGNAAVSVTGVNLALDQTAVTLYRLETRRFTATVSGTSRTEVNWTASCGTVAANGLVADWTAPSGPGACTVTAASGVDPSVTASATATVEADWVIRSLDDTDDGACTPAHCSLREALNAAQAEPGPAVIRLADAVVASRATFGLAHATSVVINLQAALPTITTPVDIVGPGAGLLTIHANATTQNPRRIFTFQGDFDADLSGMTLRGGKANGGGGAVLVTAGAEVELDAVVITDNEALTGPGSGLSVTGQGSVTLLNSSLDGNRALDNTLGFSPGGALAVLEQSTVTMTGGALRGNSAPATLATGGGAHIVAGELELAGVDVRQNSAGFGAGLYIAGGSTVTLTGGTVANNSATSNGGGVYLVSRDLVGNGVAPTLMAPQVSIVGTAITDNNAQAGAGGLGSVSRLFGAAPGSLPTIQLSLTGVTLSGNQTSGFGGGASFHSTDATVANTVIADNTGNTGGGVHFQEGTLTLQAVMLRGNASSAGGGIRAFNGGQLVIQRSAFQDNVSSGRGGGIDATNIELRIERSTLSGNTASGLGGGLVWTGNAAVASIVNSTISGNSASIGGGVALHGNASLVNVTLVQNLATSFGGGIGSPLLNAGVTPGPTFLTNTLLAGNLVSGAPGNCGVDPGSAAAITSLGHNLSNDGTCAGFLTGSGDLNSANAGVAAVLSDNGGATGTHALLAGSAAINAGDPGECPSTDQRGFGRSGICDIGAFEFGGMAPAPAFQQVIRSGVRRPANGPIRSP